MAMVCPQCNDAFQQRLDCPHCGVRLHYQAGGQGARFSSGDPENSWQQTPWGRLFVGLLLAQGVYYVLRHLSTAGLLVANEESAHSVWATLSGLIVLQAMQAVSVFSAGLLTGAGQRRGLLYGAVVGMWNSAFFLLLQRWTAQPLTAINLFGEPILHVAFGTAGGLMGRIIWKPLPTLPSVARTKPLASVARRAGPSRLAGPVAWTRVFTGVTLAVAGVMFAGVIRDFVVDASDGRLRIDTRLQAELVTWEIEVLALLVGSGFAGATTMNYLKQGLAVGIGTGALLFAFRLSVAHQPAPLLAATVASALALGLVGGWFGGQLLPPVYVQSRRNRFGPAPV